MPSPLMPVAVRTVLYRHNLTFGDDTYQASFIRDAAHGNVYDGAPDDGTVDVLTFDVTPFRTRLDDVVHAYPNPARDALYEEMWIAAEQTLANQGHLVAGAPLPAFTPEPDLPTLEALAAQRDALATQLAALGQYTPSRVN